MRYLYNTVTKVLSISLLLLTTNSFALSPEAEEGKEFYIDANCQKCHGTPPQYNAQKHKAKDIRGLQSWVTNCDVSLEIGWFPEEQTSVVQYLNEAHYKFKK